MHLDTVFLLDLAEQILSQVCPIYSKTISNELTLGLLNVQGPVVRTPVSANLGLNFNPGFFFLLSKALSGIIFSILFRVSNHQVVGKEN